ncbi:rod-binding protein [Vibrio metschnikovii]|uniref:rod-binding protein n=1 Tax=Vibrio metschnikovii TaxID=28172 RepID=UPI002FC5F323
MKLDNTYDQSQSVNILYHDNNALNQIKNAHDDKSALEAVAGQFEAMFLQMVLRQMRSSTEALSDQDSPFTSKKQGMFSDMYDGQLAIELAKKQNTGIADMLIQQLSPSMRDEKLKYILVRDSANDVKFVNNNLAEINSNTQSFLVSEQKLHFAFNENQKEVASVKEILNDVGMTAAFSQPLIRKMDP